MGGYNMETIIEKLYKLKLVEYSEFIEIFNTLLPIPITYNISDKTNIQNLNRQYSLNLHEIKSKINEFYDLLIKKYINNKKTLLLKNETL